MSATAVVILAGGEGRRIGGGKPAKVVAGQRLIDRALGSAREWSSRVAVAVRDAAQVEPVDVPIVADAPNLAGPLAGLLSAFRFGASAGCEFVITIPADMPFLPADLPERLRSAIGNRQCALASSGGHLHPVCGLWRTAALDEMDGYLKSGKRSVKGFAALLGFTAVEWAIGEIDPFLNINTPADLSRAEQLL